METLIDTILHPSKYINSQNVFTVIFGTVAFVLSFPASVLAYIKLFKTIKSVKKLKKLKFLMFLNTAIFSGCLLYSHERMYRLFLLDGPFLALVNTAIFFSGLTFYFSFWLYLRRQTITYKYPLYYLLLIMWLAGVAEYKPDLYPLFSFIFNVTVIFFEIGILVLAVRLKQYFMDENGTLAELLEETKSL